MTLLLRGLTSATLITTCHVASTFYYTFMMTRHSRNQIPMCLKHPSQIFWMKYCMYYADDFLNRTGVVFPDNATSFGCHPTPFRWRTAHRNRRQRRRRRQQRRQRSRCARRGWRLAGARQRWKRRWGNWWSWLRWSRPGMKWFSQLPSGYVKIAIENGHRNSGFSHWK